MDTKKATLLAGVAALEVLVARLVGTGLVILSMRYQLPRRNWAFEEQLIGELAAPCDHPSELPSH
jgi:hypothetical protein